MRIQPVWASGNWRRVQPRKVLLARAIVPAERDVDFCVSRSVGIERSVPEVATTTARVSASGP